MHTPYIQLYDWFTGNFNDGIINLIDNDCIIGMFEYAYNIGNFAAAKAFWKNNISNNKFYDIKIAFIRAVLKNNIKLVILLYILGAQIITDNDIYKVINSISNDKSYDTMKNYLQRIIIKDGKHYFKYVHDKFEHNLL